METHLSAMNQVLSEMQALRVRSGFEVDPKNDKLNINPTQENGFGQLLNNAIDKVNEMSQHSSELKKAYERDDPNVDITQVMIASQKAKIGMEAMTQVRNKVVEAYKDVMNMPI